jgi:hypothetical protein
MAYFFYQAHGKAMHLYLKHCVHTKGLNAHQIELIADFAPIHQTQVPA